MNKAVFSFGAAAYIAAASLIIVPSASYAKTAKACEEEWKANKAAIQASGKKKKDFVAGCRAEAAAPAHTAPANAQAAPATEQGTATATEQGTATAPEHEATAQAPAQTRTEPAPAQTRAEPAQTRAEQAPPPAKRTRTALSKTGQFPSENEAKSHCPGDTVVWANTRSRIYHFAGSSDYGHTKRGAYMCERETAAAGIRAAKDEKHP